MEAGGWGLFDNTLVTPNLNFADKSNCLVFYFLATMNSELYVHGSDAAATADFTCATAACRETGSASSSR